MNTNRRRFLKTTGLAGVAALAGTGALSQVTPAQSETTPKATTRPPEIPKNMTFCTLKQGDGYGLGLKTEKGILDVASAAHALKENAPTSIDALFKGEGDMGALKRLVDKAKAGAQAASFFIPEAQAKFGPAVTNPVSATSKLRPMIVSNDRSHLLIACSSPASISAASPFPKRSSWPTGRRPTPFR